jgi:tetratricopeptide (TPR) repeat protein
MSNREATRMKSISMAAVLVLAIGVGWGGGAPVRAQAPADAGKAFADLCQKVQKGKGDVNEGEVGRMLSLARERAQPFAAEAAVKSYLASHPAVSSALLQQMAENALLAGDYRAAAIRYKSSLALAQPGKASSDVAAAMYGVMIVFAGVPGEAYEFMKENAERFRQSDAARKFDRWFLDTAQSRKDLTGAANYLLLVAGDKPAPEKFAFFYGDAMNWILDTIRKPGSDAFAALPALQKLAPLLPGDPAAQARFRFYLANLEFKAATVGKTPEAAAGSFEPVAAAAKAYGEAAPSRATLVEISDVFSAGLASAEWRLAQAKKGEVFAAVFAKLSQADQVEIVRWMKPHAADILTPDQASALLAAHPKPFAEAAEFALLRGLPEAARKQAPLLVGKPSEYAAVVQSLAAGQDFEVCARHLMEKESWHLSPSNALALLRQQLWPLFKSFPGNEKLPADTPDVFLAAYGREALATTPLAALDPGAAGALLLAVWERSDRSALADLLNGMTWIPSSAAQRQAIYDSANRAFLAWAGKMGSSASAAATAQEKIKAYEKAVAAREAAAAAKKAAQARMDKGEAGADKDFRAASDQWSGADVMVAQLAGAAADAKAVLAKAGPVDADAAYVGAIDKAFKALLDPATFDIEKAPNPLCRGVASVMAAVRDGKDAAWEPAARSLFDQIKDFAEKKTPFGAALVTFIQAQRPDSDAALAFQAAVLDDQLGRASNSDMLAGAAAAYRGLALGRPGWPAAIPVADREKAEPFGDVLEKHVLAHADQKRFEPQVFDWLRQIRKGSGWQNADQGCRALGKLIQQKTLVGVPSYRLAGRTAACTYMWLVRHEFTRLKDQFPPETYFDEMFVEECAASGELDIAYWEIGNDSKGKITNLASKMLQQYKSIPLTLGTFTPDKELWKWHGQCLRASRSWRKDRGVDEAERGRLVAMLEAACNQTRFDEFALGAAYFDVDADASTPEGRKQFFDRLAAYAGRAAAMPFRVAPPNMLALAKADKLTDAELTTLVGLFPDVTPIKWYAGRTFEALPPALMTGLLEKKRYTDLLQMAPHFWRIAADLGNAPLCRRLSDFAGDLQTKGLSDLAALYSSAGLDIAGSAIPDDVRVAIMGLRMKSLVGITGAIPVDRTDPRYPIFEAQASFLAGNQQNAWERYQSAPDRIQDMFKELDPMFCLWIISKDTETGDYRRAEALTRNMIQWLDSMPEGYDREVRGRVMTAYADIAMARQEFPRAKALLERIVESKDFEGTKARNDAELKIAEVDRKTRNFEAAAARLERLSRRMDRYLQTESAYQLALLKFELEEFLEARELLKQVFANEPNHVNGRILEGQVNLKLKRYEQATDIVTGIQSDQKLIVPGKPLKVRLDDRNLAVAGKSAIIEVRAWSDSGDEEIFSLLPSSDSKTRFEGELPTALGKAVKGDHVLQVLGGDKVHYDYSDKFKQANNLQNVEARSMAVASDATLAASAGQLLSDNEEEQFYFEQLMRDVKSDNRALMDLKRQTTVVRPGNPVYVRVADPDASVTDQKDTVTVKVTSFSGDAIAAFPLTETDTHSGVFEGAIPTASAGAMAYATDSEEGKLPVYPILPDRSLPPWVALPNNQRPKSYNVDLNDNVALGTLRVEADVPGRRFKRFFVQTSLNGREFTTVGAWPEPIACWDGTPGFEFVNYLNNAAPRTLADIRRYMDSESIGRPVSRVIVPMTNLFARPGSTVMSVSGARIPLKWEKPAFVGRFRAAFYIPVRKTRSFSLDVPADSGLTVFFAINGVEVPPRGPLTIKRSFKKGVHFIDVYVYGRQQTAGSIQLMADSDEPPYVVPCPVSLLDPNANPEIRAGLEDNAATITAGADNTAFDIAFATNTHARAVRLVISDFETDAPAIRKVALTSAEGRAVLPVTNDVLAAGRNLILEIVSGDTISIAYEDPKVVTKGKEVQERLMSAKFNDAKITPVLVDNPDRPQGFVPLYRFVPGQKLDVSVFEPDLDVSNERDTLTFQVSTPTGKPITIKALETEEHSGIFLGAVYPVRGEPKRDNEIQVEPDEDLILTFEDRENVEPGVAVARRAIVPQASFTQPQLRVYAMESRPIDAAKLQALSNQIARLRDAQVAAASSRQEEYVVPTRDLIATRPPKADNTQPVTAVRDGPILVELLFPTIARHADSVAKVGIQTLSDRARAGVEPDAPFQPDVPGTTNISLPIGDIGNPAPPPGYFSVLVQGDPNASTPAEDGRFAAAILEPQDREVVLGFAYADAQGVTNWITQRVLLAADSFFDVMDRFYSKGLETVNLGDSIYFRVSNKSLDVSDEKDTVTIRVTTSSGLATNCVLMETYENSGVFKGLLRTVFKGDTAASADMNVLPADYGDIITAVYDPDKTAIARKVEVAKGADGDAYSFTKRFKDPAIAVQTQFTVAEAYFELAKKHRALGEESLARREIAQGQKLLEEAIRDYPDSDARVQAEYLLADLDLEFANDAENADIKKRRYLSAINRFTEIIMTHPESLYAPKSQFKKALALEKMGEIDQACEEYVKLSYLYPDSELIAETIARLGNYFANKGKEFETRMNEKTDKREQEQYRKMALAMFKTAADVFSRLAPRFPTHQLAGKTMVISGQCYIRAEEFAKGQEMLAQAIKNSPNDPELVSEAMYWRGDTYMKTKEFENAYREFKRLTWDYPASKWARYARGRLTSPELIKISISDSDVMAK